MPGCCLEVACFSVTSALVAAQAGVDRIEFCDNASVGGTTPSFDDFVKLREEISQPIFIMIRPRGGNFTYSEKELAVMKRDILRFKDRADGFVFGVLSPEGNIQEEQNLMLVKTAHPRPCTMHRAFDETSNLSESLLKIINCGFRTVLTSGGACDASTGLESLARLTRETSGRIDIMPGGNVRAKNLQDIKQKTGARWFHSSARVESSPDIANGAEIQSMRDILRAGSNG